MDTARHGMLCLNPPCSAPATHSSCRTSIRSSRHIRACAWRIGRLGKGIAPQFAARYIDGWTMVVAVVAAGRLRTLREMGEPWTEAVSFDRSCWIGNLQPIDSLINYNAFTIECSQSRAVYNTGKIFPCKEDIISLLSQAQHIKKRRFSSRRSAARGHHPDPGFKGAYTN